MKKQVNPYKADLPLFTHQGVELFEPSWLDEHAQFSQLDQIKRRSVDQTGLDNVDKLIIEYYKRLNIYTEIIEYNDIEYNPKSSAGVLVDSRNKGQYMAREIERDLPEFAEQASGLYPLDKGTLKSEITKIEKYLARDTRYFQFPNAPKYFYGARVCQAFNKSMNRIGERNNTIIAPGIQIFNGGLDTMARELEQKKHVCEADCRKFDKSVQREYHDRDFKIRVALIHPKYTPAQREEIIECLRNVYRWCCRDNFAMLNTGQVLNIIDSRKSGDVNTTNDNTTDHIRVWFAKMYDLGYHTLDQIIEALAARLYADDQLSAFDDDITPEELIAHYDRLGFELKPNMKIQNTCEGLTFLGFTMTKINGHYVGTFDRNKLNFILHVDKSKMTVQQHFDKGVAVLLLGRYTYTEQERNEIRNYLVKLKELGAVGDILNDQILDYFWSGLESSGEFDAVSAERHKKIVDTTTNLAVELNSLEYLSDPAN